MSDIYDGNSIEILEGLEAVRKRPGMYIGSVTTRGLNHMIYEIVDNSIDEHLAGFCDEITVSLNKDGSASVIDNGRGIPVGINEKMGIPAVEVVFTVLHAGGKFGNGLYKISGGLHGVGASVVNALSKWLVVRVYTDGHVYEETFEKGKVKKGLKKTSSCPKGKTGTEVVFMPDDTIFEKTKFKLSAIKSRLHEIAYLNSGLKIHFKNKRTGEEESILFYEPDGLKAYIKELNKDKELITDIIEFSGKSDDIEVEAAFQYVDEFQETILGFCNNIYTVEGGTHITGFKTRFTGLLNQYAREIGILKDKDKNFTGADIRNGMTAIITVKHTDPIFEGQTKTKLDNPDAGKAMSDILAEKLTIYFDRNLDALKAVLSCAEKSAKIRRAEEKAKTNIISKRKFSIDTNGKLANCESRKPEECEIFIVEGDSAGGSAKTARNRKIQAILPIRGKILNVEKASIDKVLANEEIKTMIHAFGCGFSEGYGDDFDISKLNYNKIIIMTDADVDGSHISTLLLTLFYRFMPELIQEGHIYLAMPPLYKVIPKRGKVLYFYNDKQLNQYSKTHKGYHVQRNKGLGEMSAEELWTTTMDPDKRTLIQIEIEDGKMASEITSLLMGTQVPPRKKFIYEHADEANIDT